MTKRKQKREQIKRKKERERERNKLLKMYSERKMDRQMGEERER